MASPRTSFETGASMGFWNEKGHLLSNNEEQLPERRERTTRSGLRYLIAAVIAVLFIGARFALDLISETSSATWVHDLGTKQDGEFYSNDIWDDWGDIPPSEKLRWHKCPTGVDLSYRCARLTVPMDYHRPLSESSEHPKVHIAMALVPASPHGNNPSQDDPSSFTESPMLVNPGGPGGSGTQIAMGPMGSLIRDLTGGKYDVIGFDPRGVGATTPSADCFIPRNTSASGTISRRNAGMMNRLTWLTAGHEIGLINSTDVALRKLAQRSKAIGMMCGQVSDHDGEDSIFKYSNTPNVARDMLSIIHAWDEWRSDAMSTGFAADEGREEIIDNGEKHHADLQEAQDPDQQLSAISSTKGKLVYWGFSYGTLLGATFASMFPNKVGRVILDGVVDADHYVGPSWIDSLMDADKIYDSLFDSCFQGKTACPLYHEGDKGPAAIKNRVEALLRALELEPRILLPSTWASESGYGSMPTLLHAGDIKSILFMALYSPNTVFPLMAPLLNALYEDDKSVIDLLGSGPGLPILCGSEPFPLQLNDAQKAIMCSDKRYKLDETVPELQKRFERVAKFSRFADIWLGLNMDCNHWPIEAKDPPMDWDNHPIHKPEPIITSFPILFLSNTLDPVTPLRAALKMTRKFANASIVEQAAEGHCTISCVSACTVGHVRAYLNEGVLPKVPKFGDGLDEGDWAKCICTQKPYGSTSDEMQGLDNGLKSKYEQVHRDVLKNIPGAQVSEWNPFGKYIMQGMN